MKFLLVQADPDENAHIPLALLTFAIGLELPPDQGG